MLNLLFRPVGMVLTCTDCDSEWPLQESKPFVVQLRVVSMGHSCSGPARAAAESHAARRSHLHLVDEGAGS